MLIEVRRVTQLVAGPIRVGEDGRPYRELSVYHGGGDTTLFRLHAHSRDDLIIEETEEPAARKSQMTDEERKVILEQLKRVTEVFDEISRQNALISESLSKKGMPSQSEWPHAINPMPGTAPANSWAATTADAIERMRAAEVARKCEALGVPPSAIRPGDFVHQKPDGSYAKATAFKPDEPLIKDCVTPNSILNECPHKKCRKKNRYETPCLRFHRVYGLNKGGVNAQCDDCHGYFRVVYNEPSGEFLCTIPE